MKYWPNRVFSFLLSVTEVNVNLAATYFAGQEPTGQIIFCINSLTLILKENTPIKFYFKYYFSE